MRERDRRTKLTIPGWWIAAELRALGRASGEDVPKRVEKMKAVLAQRGGSLDDVAEHLERQGVDLRDSLIVAAEFPVTFDSIHEMFARHSERIALADHPFIGELDRKSVV